MNSPVVTAQIIDGKQVAGRVRIGVARDVEAFAQEFGGARPGLATVLVGDDPASAVYVNGKQKACREVGMQGFNFPLPADASRGEVVALIERLNADPEVSGILLQLPVPPHLDGVELTGMVDPRKD
ncbi:MAG: methylenetetrahydrofolate dehydrogenase / methenyltetrahydrofolate cyclohydrolase, partial [Solirubrobacteraceae bacterium]|nr:methylenetetrahydrofolate dehydrogenase / methenyltetrahydrofolate cyclohydrolase [Solirubrobacteraceae bacterium]